MTTFVGVNPSFRIWAYDRTTFEVVDYQQWNTNLTLANIVDDATYVDTHLKPDLSTIPPARC